MAQFTGYAGFSAVVQDNVFYNGQPQAGATGFAGPPFVHTIEPFKQSG